MFSWEILFNLLIVIPETFVLLKFRKSDLVRNFIFGFFTCGLFALVMSFMFPPDGFGTLRLLCWWVFIHFPVLCFISSPILYQTSKPTAILNCFAGIAVVAIGIDAFFIEPQQLQVTPYSVVSEKIDRQIKIVVLSDIQTDEITDYEKQVVETALAEKPDMIVLTGDYVQISDTAKRQQAMTGLNLLLRSSGFIAPLGVYACGGDVDDAQWQTCFEGLDSHPGQGGVECFTNSRTLIKERIAITGLGIGDSFNEKLKINLPDSIARYFHIVFGHAPDYAISGVQADLCIAGHTHGGQVRLPFIGPLITLSKVPGKWSSGMNKINDDTHLIVSRGIGMERNYAPRLRFFCKPEIVVVTVEFGIL